MAMADGYGLFWNSDSGDRKYDAQSFEKWLKKFFTSGVFEGDLQVLASSGMTVQVQTGYSNVNGKVGLFESATNVTLSAANSRYPRIDTIIIERNDVDRVIQIDKVTGAYTGENPQPTAPIWDETQGIYQLVLAQIYVAAGVSSITQSDITDKRTDTTVCGYISGTVQEMDFSQFAAQFESYYKQFVASNQEDFETWFDHMKDQLDSDAAGHLQAEVDEINGIIAPVQLTLTASQPYAIGEQFIYGGKLYTATSAIAKGGTIVIGTNASLSAEIVKQIKSAKDAIGNLASLTTDAKTSAVAAINEVQGVTGDNGRAIAALQTLTIMLSAPGASRANSFIYEYDLGTSFTNDQSADIVAGTFDKVRTGGYWTINGRKYWAAHADYRLNCGDTELTKHHMLVFPDKNIYYYHMNATNVTTGAYYGSDMVANGLAQALATVKADFGESHVLTYRNLLANAISGDRSSNWAWYDRQIDLMNQAMVYGHVVWAGNGHDVGCDKSQIALFQARPDLIVNRENWWLRDVQSSTNFCFVLNDGRALSWSASDVFGVRPAFLIA